MFSAYIESKPFKKNKIEAEFLVQGVYGFEGRSAALTQDVRSIRMPPFNTLVNRKSFCKRNCLIPES